MQYGPSIPPRSFLNNSPQFFTKQGFANYMARALQSVGMIPLSSINSYDLADPANAERNSGNNEDNVFWWDYPTTETFDIGGVQYRPCLGLSHSIYRSYYNNNISVQGKTYAYYIGQSVCFMPFRRRADRIMRSDMKCHNTLYRGRTANYGFGGNTDQPSDHFAENGGSGTGFAAWKLSATFADSNMQQLLFVNRVFVHLSPAGLVVQVGTHPTRRDETCNIMNFMVAFHGGRIPSRGLAPANDVLRDRVDPVAWFDLGAYADGAYANSSRSEMACTLLGAGRTFNTVYEATNASVLAYLRDIDYLDLSPVNNAPLDNYPRPSPSIRNGNGVHLLHRACLFTYNTVGGATNVGRIDTVVQPNTYPMTAWYDAFYLPGIALCDRVVPPGVRTDPATGIPWYMIWATPRQQAFAIKYDGVTTVSTPTAGAEVLNLAETINLDVTSVATFEPPYSQTTNRSEGDTPKIGHARTLLGVFGGITAYIGQREYMSVASAPANRWIKPTGENGFSILNLGRASSDSDVHNHLYLELEGLSTDDRDYYYFEYRYRGRVNNSPSSDPATQDYYYCQQSFGGGDFFNGDAAVDWFNYNRVGATVSYQNVYYNYLTYGAKGQLYPAGAVYTGYSITCFKPNAAGRAMVFFNSMKNHGTTDPNYCPSFDLRDFVLKRYRRA